AALLPATWLETAPHAVSVGLSVHRQPGGAGRHRRLRAEPGPRGPPPPYRAALAPPRPDAADRGGRAAGGCGGDGRHSAARPQAGQRALAAGAVIAGGVRQPAAVRLLRAAQRGDHGAADPAGRRGAVGGAALAAPRLVAGTGGGAGHRRSVAA